MHGGHFVEVADSIGILRSSHLIQPQFLIIIISYTLIATISPTDTTRDYASYVHNGVHKSRRWHIFSFCVDPLSKWSPQPIIHNPPCFVDVCGCVCVCVLCGQWRRLEIKCFLGSFEFVNIYSLDLKIMDNIMDRIPHEKIIHHKLVAGGYADRDSLPKHWRPMDRWDTVKTACSLTGVELSRLMYILLIPDDLHDKLAARGYVGLDDLPNNDKSMERWIRVEVQCGLIGGELNRLMNSLFPVGK
jgi:hypothetical protein